MLITTETKTFWIQQWICSKHSAYIYATAKWETAEAANRRKKHEWGNTEINVKPDYLISETIFTVVNY